MLSLSGVVQSSSWFVVCLGPCSAVSFQWAHQSAVYRYLPTVVDAYTISRAKVPLINLRNQIKNFHAMEGRYPESLKELADWQKTTIPDLPSRLEFRYSAETGDVVVVEIPKE